MCAALNGQLDCLRELLNAGVDKDAANKVRGWCEEGRDVARGEGLGGGFGGIPLLRYKERLPAEEL